MHGEPMADVKLTPEQRADRIAGALMKLRGCDGAGCSAEGGAVPCPFCFWPLDADEESGCYTWAEKIIEALDRA